MTINLKGYKNNVGYRRIGDKIAVQLKENAEEQEQKHEQDPGKLAMMQAMARFLEEKRIVGERLAQVKHKIGIYSAKGGVGKTTIAVNVAYALSTMGYKVGLMDVDIDCPNVTLFIGLSEKIPQTYPLKPVEHQGVKVISTAMFVDDAKKPIIWRGPIQSKMIKDFLARTDWGELDYLIMDLAPGTSDTALTILQILNLDGFLIVTTPQRISALNATRSGAMVKRLNSSLLGVVENMSDGSKGTAEDVAKELGTVVLGRVKKDQKFNDFSDAGKVPVLTDDGIRQGFIDIIKRFINK